MTSLRFCRQAVHLSFTVCASFLERKVLSALGNGGAKMHMSVKREIEKSVKKPGGIPLYYEESDLEEAFIRGMYEEGSLRSPMCERMMPSNKSSGSQASSPIRWVLPVRSILCRRGIWRPSCCKNEQLCSIEAHSYRNHHSMPCVSLYLIPR